MADPTGIVSTFPLLLFFLGAWIFFLVLALHYQIKENRNVELTLLFHGFSLGMIFFIIAFSIVEVTCVECECQNVSEYEQYNCSTWVGEPQYVQIGKISEAFYGLFIIQAIYFVWVCLRLGVTENRAFQGKP